MAVSTIDALYNGTSEKLTTSATGITVTGNATFGDNDKAIFGAGSDLQIYHSGSHSVIKDAGDGNLQLIANDFQLRNGADNANMMTGANGGAITLMHNGSSKLATTSTGVDVTGTVTSDGLTVDGTPVRFNSTAPMLNFMETGVADSNHRIRQNAGNLYIQKLSDDEGTATDRLIIDGGSGNVLVGTTTSGGSSGLTIQPGTNGSPAYVQWNKANSPSEGCMVFRFNGAAKGSVTYTSTGTAFNTTSDYRVKENVVDLTGASARVNQLDVKRFNFIDDDTNTVVDGFLAHEVATVVPEAITGAKDAVDDDGNPEYQGIDQSKLVPLLTAALQEALTEIASLKTRVEALEA